MNTELTKAAQQAMSHADATLLLDRLVFAAQAGSSVELEELLDKCNKALTTSQPAQTDSMGMPTSCGKPLCAPDEHHPLCKLHKPAQAAQVPVLARSLSEWHEEDGTVIWWAWNGEARGWAGEAAYIGSPLCDDWPGYHTHWTPHPPQPMLTAAQQGAEHD